MINSKIIGYGSYLPSNIMTNNDVAKIVDTSDEWIYTRTGIKQRHIAAKDEYTSDLAANAANAAINNASISPEDVDMILLATATPDKTFPSAATLVQQKTGCKNASAMDVNAACSGFIYILHLAKALIATGQAKTILLIGAETMSRVVDWNDRGTCILFGDGAGALIVQANNSPKHTSNLPSNEVQNSKNSGLIHSKIYSDGNYSGILATNGGISQTQTAGTLFMEGGDVFRHAVSKMSAVSKEVIADCGLSSDDIDWVIPHQANARILHSCIKKLGVSEEKLINTVEYHANTSSATIPLALAYAAADDRLQKGDIIAMPALGAGLTWGCAVVSWL